MLACMYWLSVALFLPVSGASAAVIDWVTVGHPGNAADTTGFGAVANAYRISRTEVTNVQYAEFLNAVAATDTYGLYDSGMGSAPGGIARSGSSGNFSYSAIAGRETKPVNFVGFYNALRFANWMHNGQPMGTQGPGTTEDGAYTLTQPGILDNSVVRNQTATVFVPSEDEWYKAAYYDSVSGSYFIYPAATNLATICNLPSALSNRANCLNAVGDVTDVESYTGSPSPNGTFDQGGNVQEWTDGVSRLGRIERGGAFSLSPDLLRSSFRHEITVPWIGQSDDGFRIATVVAQPAVIDWVTVGHPGNAADTTGFGAVANAYRISRTEVTNVQYAEFLNAVAATDTHALYKPIMGSSTKGGISRGGSAGQFFYGARPGRERMPVNYVSFYDASRFANWLHNGRPVGDQGPGTTEDGAYAITALGITNNSVAREPGAVIFLPSEDEWYKAAYYNPVSRSYFRYPAGTSTRTRCAAPGAVPNTANCDRLVDDVTLVGSYSESVSPNGTFDQGGNVWEWTEGIINGGRWRVQRGGGYSLNAFNLEAGTRFGGNPTGWSDNWGFRVASVPEPEADTSFLVMAGTLGLLARRRRSA